MLPDQIENIFTEFSPQSNYSIRSYEHKILTEPGTKLKSTQDTYRISLPKLLNNIDNNFISLTELDNINTCKHNVKSLIISQYSDLDCVLPNCYPCNQRLFFPSYLPRFVQFIHVFSYRTPF